MSKDMRIRFDAEEPELSWKGKEVFHWILKNREDDGRSSNDNKEVGVRRVSQENQTTGGRVAICGNTSRI